MPSFEDINDRIQTFLQEAKIVPYTLKDKQYKLPLSDAIFCAQDTRKNRAFFDAIKKAIKNLRKLRRHIIVVDAGSGTGILGIFALCLGADKCHFLEHNPFSLEFSKKLVAFLRLSKKSVFIQCDASSYAMPEPYDLLISETVTSGFVIEDFVRIINNLKAFASPNGIIIPEKFKIEAIEEGGFTHIFFLKSCDGFKRMPLVLKNPFSKHIKWHTSAFLYDDIMLQSGDTPSFLNERTTAAAGFQHPIFDISLPFFIAKNVKTR